MLKPSRLSISSDDSNTSTTATANSPILSTSQLRLKAQRFQASTRTTHSTDYAIPTNNFSYPPTALNSTPPVAGMARVFDHATSSKDVAPHSAAPGAEAEVSMDNVQDHLNDLMGMNRPTSTTSKPAIIQLDVVDATRKPSINSLKSNRPQRSKLSYNIL
ncbi:hypothetical protein BCR33DRAFT_720098 [Rhizoclosmatium globosum]|uniref:Uncharacterized protein n=1 Tax=Rhizoclosmatium globosum TaxID=329046 RepID=A0A1Y2BY26_9FUNG|nr:hypothetical protein BCR33DRAFT_720098 [Rhizoclosmatium globosum]|eukprot:ORY39661.1 hypothetical protein BCR33DRAFT_720098 [Rhizoclosmatium globosum]